MNEMDTHHDSDILMQSTGENSRDQFTSTGDSYQFFDVDCERVILTLAHPFKLHFYGCVSVVSLAGLVDVNGFIIKPGMKATNVYSLFGSSALYFQTISSPCVDFMLSDLYVYGFSLMSSTKIVKCMNENGCILLLTKIESPLSLPKSLNHFEYPERSHNSSRPERIVSLSIERLGITFPNKLKIPPDILGHRHLRTIVCGGKGVGKSTTLRYLLNESLNQFDKVLYLDFDIGQPEFTMPECLSVVLVTEPVLGPSYCTFREPLYSHYVGDIDASKILESYRRGVETLVAKCSGNPSLAKIPWLINTMGFPKGIGILITGSIIACVKPTLLIQFQGKKAQNFPETLTANYVFETCRENIPAYRVIVVDSPSKAVVGSTGELFSNKQCRWLRIQSYFSNPVSPSEPTLISLDSVSVVNVQNKASIAPELYSHLTSKIVTLSESFHNDDNIAASGCAVILDYNETERTFTLLTPIKFPGSIKTILVGSLQIPSQINAILKPTDSGVIPYAQVGVSKSPALKPAQRKFRFLFGHDNST